MNQRKSKNMILNPEFQYRTVGFFMALTVLMVVLQGATLYFFFARFESLLIGMGLPAGNAVFGFLHKQQAYLYSAFTAVSAVVVLIMLIGGFILSHRVAGPLLKVENKLNSIDPKKPETLEPLVLRSTDFFPEFRDALNAMLKRVREG